MAGREPEQQEVEAMKCPNCGTEDPPPPTKSDNQTTTCPECGHRFPIDESDPQLLAAAGA